VLEEPGSGLDVASPSDEDQVVTLSKRWQDLREDVALGWQLRDPDWWGTALVLLLFFGTPVIGGVVLAFVLHQWLLFLVLLWPALWLVMGATGL
jgi:hypothetical protein